MSKNPFQTSLIALIYAVTTFSQYYSPKQHNVSCTAIETLSKSLETMDKCAEIFSETTFSHIAFAKMHIQSYIAYIPDRKSGNKKKERKKT